MAKHKGSKRRVLVRKATPSGICLADSPDPGPGTKAINPRGRKGARDMGRGKDPAPPPDHSDQLHRGKLTRQLARQALRIERKERESAAKAAALRNRRSKGNGKGKGKE